MTLKNLNRFKSARVTSILRKKRGRINPVLVSFQNGDLTEGRAPKDLEATLSLNESGATKVDVKSPSDGQSFAQADFAHSKTNQFIAIRNKKTNKMKIVEVDSVLLINSVLVNSEKNCSAQVGDVSGDITRLNRTFGGKKIVSRLQQREKLNVNSSLVDDVVKVAVNDIRTDADESFSNCTAETESIIELLPPCNRSALNVSDVYSLSDIFTDEEFEALKKEVVNVGLDEKIIDANDDEYSLFFKECHNELNKRKAKIEDFRGTLGALLFIETLIKFLKTPTKLLGGKKANFSPFSSIIHSKLLSEFCIRSGTTVTRPFSMRDKVLCHIMAIALVCCDYKINLKSLAVVSSVHLNRLSRLARAVGAVPTSKDEGVFVLKLPLPPLPRTAAPKGKIKK